MIADIAGRSLPICWEITYDWRHRIPIATPYFTYVSDGRARITLADSMIEPHIPAKARGAHNQTM